MNDKLIETFLDEAHELLDGLEDQLLELEKNPANIETMNAAFRALHSIKGSASMFGFEAVGAFAHEVEAALDYFRSAALPATPELSDAVLRSRDHIRALLDAPETASSEEREDLVATLAALSGKTAKPAAPAAPPSAPKSIKSFTASGFKTFRIRYKPSADVYHRGVKPEALVRELRELGEASVRCDCGDVPPLTELDPESCYLAWNVLLTTSMQRSAVTDVFIFEEGTSEISVEEINHDDVLDGDEVRKLGEILAARRLPEVDIDTALSRQRPIGEILVKELGTPKKVVEDALFEQQHARNVVQAAREESEKKTIRIRSDKLDGLLNLVGELVTVQAQLSQTVKDSSDRHLHGISDYVKRLAGELRATSMELRLVPVDSLFAKFKRLARDLSKNLEKELELKLEGGETEIDKSVIDVLNDPLVHLVRNAADHGLERTADRARLGKPASGTITMKAQHAGAFVRISVCDDGKGLDRDKIFKKAVDRGLVSADARLTEEEIDQLIFKPGFSTADVVSNVSGRGVGLDVVKTAIDQLGGTLTVHSQLGKGTEFYLDIPLTLAIIDGFLVRSGKRNFVIPLSSVDSCFERERPQNPERLIVRGKDFIPYVSSRDMFGEDEAAPTREEVVIVSVFDSKLAIGFDQVIGGYQTVIKPIGEIARYATGVSGAAILADGGIALILDVAALARSHKGA
ncbi:MAG: chemotaxis protein CheA [Spirochaetes bacterium]|nr:chemotaxis protein CheA [Spirochaetota bacterium]MBU1082164.1 chemotaxis protein CheA [Spirochaetota bacterium]